MRLHDPLLVGVTFIKVTPSKSYYIIEVHQKDPHVRTDQCIITDITDAMGADMFIAYIIRCPRNIFLFKLKSG